MKVFIADSNQNQSLVTKLSELLEAHGHEMVHPFGLDSSEGSASRIIGALGTADTVVIVLTSSQQGALYELGMALGAGMSVVVVAPSPSDIPSDLVCLPFQVITGDTQRDALEIVRRLETKVSSKNEPPLAADALVEALRAVMEEPSVLTSRNPADLGRCFATLLRSRNFHVLHGEAPDVCPEFIIMPPGLAGPALVEIKAYPHQEIVSVDSVRRLALRIDSSGASRGIMISTSPYSQAAQAFGASHRIMLMTLIEPIKLREDALRPQPGASSPSNFGASVTLSSSPRPAEGAQGSSADSRDLGQNELGVGVAHQPVAQTTEGETSVSGSSLRSAKGQGQPFEVMMIFVPTLDDGVIRAEVDRVVEFIRARGGSPGRVDHWGRRRLAYELAGNRNGYYVLLEATAHRVVMADLHRNLGLTNAILRHKVVRIPNRDTRGSSQPSEAAADTDPESAAADTGSPLLSWE